MFDQPVRFIQRLVARELPPDSRRELPPERVGEHFIAIYGQDGGEIERARLVFELVSRRLVFSGSVQRLYERWAAVGILAEMLAPTEARRLARILPKHHLQEALELVLNWRVDRPGAGATMAFPAKWHPWLALQIVLHYVARDEARRLGRRVTVDTVVPAPDVQFRTRPDESVDEVLKRLESQRQALVSARKLSPDDRSRQAREGARSLLYAVAWFFDGRNSTKASAGIVDTDADGKKRQVVRSDAAKNVRRGRKRVQRLLDLVTLEFPTSLDRYPDR